jgi:hypothetical protein
VAAARGANERILQALRAESQEIARDMERARRNDKRVQQSMETAATLLQELQAVEDRTGMVGDLVGYSSRVLNLANDAVSTLGFAQEEATTTVQQLLQAHQSLARFLEQPLRTAEDEELAERLPAMSQVAQEALSELREAVSEIDSSQERIQRANFAAAEAVQSMHQTFYVHRLPQSGARDFRYSLEDAERSARDALERARGIARATSSARARTYQLRLDALLSGATPAQQRVAAGLLQHFLIVPAENVSALRDGGHSFGETTLLLAGARSQKQNPEELAGASVTYDKLVNTLKDRRVRLDHLNVMLKLLTNALEVEMDEASYQENARTWAREA